MSEKEYLERFGKSRKEMLKETKKKLRQASSKKDKEEMKKAYAELKRAFIGDDIFWANEVVTNLFATVILVILSAIMLITIIFAGSGVYSFDINSILIGGSVCIAQMMIGAIICWILKGEAKWLKYIMVILITASIAMATSFLGYRTTIALTVPVIFSTKYFSAKFTRLVAIFSGFLMFTSTITFAFMGVSYDLNNISIPSGTTLEITTSLKDVLTGSNELLNGYVLNMLTRTFMPNLFQFILVAFICVQIAKWGHANLIDQATMAGEFARVDTELNVATNIQAKSLPNIFPAFPEREEIDIYASMDPAKEVGGDFYDFFFIDENHLALVIADVSGKGIPAALFMMIGKVIIRNFSNVSSSPAEILAKANSQLCESNEENFFITAWLGIIDLRNGQMMAANAGHEYPIIYRKDGTYEIFKDKHGLPLGSMDGISYKEYDLTLNPGDKLFVYTDGVAEATNSSNELYGLDRLLEVLNKNITSGQQELLIAVREDVDKFVGTAPQFDDLTMVGFEYKGLENI